MKSHIGHSLENDTWFLRYYPFKTRKCAELFNSKVNGKSLLDSLEELMEFWMCDYDPLSSTVEYVSAISDAQRLIKNAREALNEPR